MGNNTSAPGSVGDEQQISSTETGRGDGQRMMMMMSEGNDKEAIISGSGLRNSFQDQTSPGGTGSTGSMNFINKHETGGLGARTGSASVLSSSSLASLYHSCHGDSFTNSNNNNESFSSPGGGGGGGKEDREKNDTLDSSFSPAAISSTAVSPRMRSRVGVTPSASVSASTSFDERFKYKISIYSKVSGCRMTNLPDYTIVKQIRVCILEYITLGNPHDVLNVKFAYEKMKNGGLQVITDDKRLATALAGLGYFACIPCKMTFPNSPRVVGFVKDLPINMEPAELKWEIRKQLPEVYSVRYITERSAGRSRPMQRPCAFVSFNLRYLPGNIRVYGKEYEILVPNPMQCTRCCRYGHQGKQCRAEVRCPICGKAHSKQQCTATAFRCVNCKGGHSSTSHECEIWQQGKLMNELRYRGGLTAEEAIDVASDGKIQHKKHHFIAPADEYFDNQESFYLGVSGGGSGDGSSDDVDVLHSTMIAPDANEAGDTAIEAYHHEDANIVFHPRYVATQEFLDLLTDFYLKITNPNDNFTSSVLMPGFEDDSMMERMNLVAAHNSKKPSQVAQQFKLSVIRACVFDDGDIGQNNGSSQSM